MWWIWGAPRRSVGEGLLRRRERLDRVALDERDLVPGAAEREGRGETADPATADQHPLRHLTSRRSHRQARCVPGTLERWAPRSRPSSTAPYDGESLPGA